MKNLVITLVIISSLSVRCQTVKTQTYQDIKVVLIDFLFKTGDIREKEINDFKNGKYGLDFFGIYNHIDYNKTTLIDGIYSFSLSRTHTRTYFLIIENNSNIILNLSTRDGLNKSIIDVVDFAERKKYCSEITQDYVSRMIRIYYKNNKNPTAGIDINCERGIIDTKDLP